ncbi:transcriptional regulator [Chryseobacterium oryctis]|uniref:Tetratricopeptide repeat protein n=1 Tax=Chryseobacterium oryctis TaxID=2952618 RepID=A0ABT3HNC7_9FLAO|nr:tetratricopeptide repeat protein [Chryseobacterium oryctis]MCW3161298.1 tetratricopeptide repeat protein [Chryseobacterium oryctis]
MKKKIYFLVLLLLSKICFSQSDLDFDQQSVYTYLYNKNPEKAISIINSNFLTSSNLSKKIIGYVYLTEAYSDNEIKKAKALENAKKLSMLTKEPLDEAYVQFGYAKYYLNLNKNDLFIKSINNSINTFSKYNNENFVLSQLYYHLNRYLVKNPLEKDTRNSYFKANYHAIKSKNNLLISITYNNIGIFYKKKFTITNDKKYLDSANINYQNSYKYALNIKDTEAQKRTLAAYYMNYGHLLENKIPYSYKKCLELYNKCLSISGKDNSFKDMNALIYINIGSAYEKAGQTLIAEKYYSKAYHLIKNNKDIFTTHKLILLDNLSKIYQNLNQYEKALEFEREAKNLIKEDTEKRFSNNTKALEIFYKTEQKDKHIKELKEKNEVHIKQKIIYLMISLIAFLGIICMFFILQYKHKLSKQRTSLLEAEKKETELILQLEKEEKSRLKTEQELLALQQEQLQKQALATSLQLNYKSAILNELKEVIENDDPNLKKILKEDQLADNDFNDLQNIIQQIHPNFFKRLQELSKSKLTNQDLKYCAYINLNMNNFQISNILKVDPKTVRVTKYRLKQKLGLKKEDDLYDFIRSLDV